MVKASRLTFKVNDLSTSHSTSNSISISNVTNKLSLKITKIWIDPGLLVGKATKSSFLTAFKQTFIYKRLRELTREKVIVLTLFFTPEGKVVEVEYFLKKTAI